MNYDKIFCKWYKNQFCLFSNKVFFTKTGKGKWELWFPKFLHQLNDILHIHKVIIWIISCYKFEGFHIFSKNHHFENFPYYLFKILFKIWGSDSYYVIRARLYFGQYIEIFEIRDKCIRILIRKLNYNSYQIHIEYDIVCIYPKYLTCFRRFIEIVRI